MFRLLIVDDEEIITDGLHEVFVKLEEPELDVYKAYSGEEALELLRRTRVDIVLTDIRMPGMDGLELMERIRANWPRCRVVFLTGYNEFDFVYRAIQTPGVSYLLKTEGYAKIIETVADIVRELEDSLKIDDLLHRSRKLEDALASYRHGDYLTALLEGKASASELASDFAATGMPLDHSLPVALAVGYPTERRPDGSYARRRETLRAVQYLADSFLEKQVRSLCAADRHGHLIWFMQPAEAGRPGAYDEAIRFVRGMLELVQQACKESLDLPIAFAMSDAPSPWAEAPGSYERLRQTLRLRIGDGEAMVLTDRAVDDGIDAPPRRDRPPGLRAELLADCLEAGRRDAFFAVFDEQAEEIAAADEDEAGALEAYYAVSLLLLSHINRWRLPDMAGDAQSLMRYHDHASGREAAAYLRTVAEALFEQRHTEERRRAQRVMERVRTHIDEHLAEELSLVRLAELVHFNPSYLSRLFKQECGINLSRYIEETRIRKAKELLADEACKIHEVGAAVGYENAHSFTRFFRKATGLSPQEYKKALTNK